MTTKRNSPKPAPTALQTLETVKARLNECYKGNMSWEKVAREFGVSVGTAVRVARGYEPHKASVRAALGLPVLVTVPACGKCGVVHVRVTCPPATKPSAPRRAPLNRRKLAVKLLGLLWG